MDKSVIVIQLPDEDQNDETESNPTQTAEEQNSLEDEELLTGRTIVVDDRTGYEIDDYSPAKAKGSVSRRQKNSGCGFSKEFLSNLVTLKEGKWHCPECDKGFRQKNNTVAHWKMVHMNIVHKCGVCGLRVKKLRQHMNDVHKEKVYEACVVCGKSYVVGKLMRDHVRKTHGKLGGQAAAASRSEVCPVCRQTVVSSKMDRHMHFRHYLPTGSSVVCPLCCARVKYMVWHFRKCHKGLDYTGTLERCRRCDAWFKTKGELNAHLEQHEDYRCVDCMTQYERYLDLARHMFQEHGKVFNVSQRGKKKKRKKKASGKPSIFEPVPAAEEPPNGELVTTTVYLNNDGRCVPARKEHQVVGDKIFGSWPIARKLGQSSESTAAAAEPQLPLEPGVRAEVILPDVEISVQPQQDGLDGLIIIKKDKLNDIGGSGDELVSQDRIIYIKEDSVHGKTEAADGGNRVSLKLVEETLQDLEPVVTVLKVLPVSWDADSEPQTVNLELVSEAADSGELLADDAGGTAGAIMEADLTLTSELPPVGSGSDMPRYLSDVVLSTNDEAVISSAPEVDSVTIEDLSRYQITSGHRPPQTDRFKRYQNCPSRQAHLCPYCRKVLKNKDSLKRHIDVVHRKKKPFECNFCDKAFPTNGDRKKHILHYHDSVASQKEVPCRHCGLNFKLRYLQRHITYEHKERAAGLPAVCQHCGNQYKTRDIMLRHVRKVHK